MEKKKMGKMEEEDEWKRDTLDVENHTTWTRTKLPIAGEKRSLKKSAGEFYF